MEKYFDATKFSRGDIVVSVTEGISPDTLCPVKTPTFYMVVRTTPHSVSVQRLGVIITRHDDHYQSGKCRPNVWHVDAQVVRGRMDKYNRCRIKGEPIRLWNGEDMEFINF